MKVYVVWYGEYDSRGIWRIFSSMEKAELVLHPRGGSRFLYELADAKPLRTRTVLPQDF